MKHREYIPGWEVAMSAGFISGRPFSKYTVTNYMFYIKQFMGQFDEVNITNLKHKLASIHTDHFATRDKLVKALICFGKYLISEGALDEGFVEAAAKIRPKRHLPPKRTRIKVPAILDMLSACKTPKEKAVITLLATTGVRASELCFVQWKHIDLELAELTLPKRKWGKDAKLGLPSDAVAALKLLQDCTLGWRAKDFVFGGITRFGLYRLIRRVGQRVGIHAHPHAFRAAFVTTGIALGWSMTDIQTTCSHSKIETTRGYDMTDEEEVIARMKGRSILVS